MLPNFGGAALTLPRARLPIAYAMVCSLATVPSWMRADALCRFRDALTPHFRQLLMAKCPRFVTVFCLDGHAEGDRPACFKMPITPYRAEPAASRPLLMLRRFISRLSGYH